MLYADILREGSINRADIYINEIITLCIKYKAVYVIIAHNHPSGNILPSIDDIQTTKSLNSALKLINVKLLDHIIFANDECLSLAESGLDDTLFE